MIKVYQIFVDEKAGWATIKPEDFEDDIIDAYMLEYDRNIPQGELTKIMNAINKMDVWSNIEFRNIKLKFYCREMSKEDFDKTPEW